MLEKALRAIAAPQHQRAVHGAGGYELRPSPERMGQAFAGTLRGGLAAATVDTGSASAPLRPRRVR